MRGGGREAFLHVAIEFGARGIERVAGMDEPGIGGEPAEQIVEPLVALDGFRERAAGVGAVRKRGEPALEVLLEGDRVLIRPVEIAFHRRVVDAGVKVAEIGVFRTLPVPLASESVEVVLEAALRARRTGLR